jgi:hypothetical protein
MNGPSQFHRFESSFERRTICRGVPPWAPHGPGKDQDYRCEQSFEVHPASDGAPTEGRPYNVPSAARTFDFSSEFKKRLACSHVKRLQVSSAERAVSHQLFRNRDEI